MVISIDHGTPECAMDGVRHPRDLVTQKHDEEDRVAKLPIKRKTSHWSSTIQGTGLPKKY
jgi:hypothetical protein